MSIVDHHAIDLSPRISEAGVADYVALLKPRGKQQKKLPHKERTPSQAKLRSGLSDCPKNLLLAKEKLKRPKAQGPEMQRRLHSLNFARSIAKHLRR